MRFGTRFTDHMVTMSWTSDSGWKPAELLPYGPFELPPAAAVLHFGQGILEGLKAYRHADDSVWTFRPDANAERFGRSAYRLAMPELPAEDFVSAVDRLVSADRQAVPAGEGETLYLRPFMFATEGFLVVRPSRRYTFCVIASPAGGYFGDGTAPISLWLSQPYARAAPGGTGAAKCGGNYAASLQAQQEAIGNWCDQVCFIGGDDTVQELGASNIWFVYDDGGLVTPELDGAILNGITRDAIRTLAIDAGHTVEERPVTVQEWRDGVTSGRITEVFACGTAALVTPIGRLRWASADGVDELTWAPEHAGPVTVELRRRLLDICYGRAPDRYGWLHRADIDPPTSTPVHD